MIITVKMSFDKTVVTI